MPAVSAHRADDEKAPRRLTTSGGRNPRPPVRRIHVSVNPGRLLASPFFPSSLALQFCEDPPRPNSRCLLKPAPARPSPSSGRRRQGLVVPGSYRQFTDLPAVSAHLPRAAGRYGFAAPAAVWCPRGRALSTLASPGRCSSRSGEAAEPIYHSLCAVLQRTLARFGVASHAGR
ncbi:lipoate-protein ligase A [Klebsiella pneumoniae]|uniref:Lipoate-protein ligase A n=1 Tax=Klebsiella pneumoniae TaxID=573 RepID=A0A378FZX8_KLEPN|nr:lipoate-protein ligase A [Klebsiella pneumoniae]